MAAAFVQKGSNQQFSGTTIAVTLTVAAGNLLAIFVHSTVTTVTISSVDGNSNTYTLADGPTNVGSANRAWNYYAKSINSGSTTVTAHFSADAGSAAMVVHEISGCDTSAPLDQHVLNAQTNAGTGANAYTSTAKTTTTNGQYIFGATGNDNFSVATVGTGFTIRESAADPCSEDQIQTSAGSIAATFTETDGFNNSLTSMMTFKAASTTVIALEWKSPWMQPVNHYVPTIVSN